jgi:hypothetical protein
VEHDRCAQCRNPIRGRQASVRHARSGLTFHTDCWVDLHAHVQAQYLQEVTDEGVAALMHPYQRNEMASWLPDAAIDAAAEELTEQLEELAVDSVVPPAAEAGPEAVAG